MAFKKGESGNPSGRARKTAEQVRFETRCREWSDTLGFDKLKRWADCDDAGKSLEALKEIFNRGFGHSVATQILEANVTTESGASVEAIAGELAEALGGVEVEGGAGPSQAPMDKGA